MVTYCVAKIITMCSPVVGQFFIKFINYSSVDQVHNKFLLLMVKGFAPTKG